MQLRNQKNSSGLTLVEIIVVVFIIGILALISTPNFITAIRNYRLRAAAINLLTALRETRSEAIGKGRMFKFTVNTTNFTYTRERLPFSQIDVLKLPCDRQDCWLFEEKADDLATINNDPANKNVFFNYQRGILSMETTPTTIELTFNPAGTITVPGTGLASFKMYGPMFGYEIKVYKGGQITFHKISLP